MDSRMVLFHLEGMFYMLIKHGIESKDDHIC